MLKCVVLVLVFVVSQFYYYEYAYCDRNSYSLQSEVKLRVSKHRRVLPSTIHLNVSKDGEQPTIISLDKRLLPVRSLYQKKPWITDIFAVPKNKKMTVYAIFSALNLPVKRMNVAYNHFTLYYRHFRLHDLMPKQTHAEALRVLKFILPVVIKDPFFNVTIIDEIRRNTYEDLPVEVLSNKKLGGFGACAMISDFNPPEEMMNWVGWYKYQKLTSVMLYSIKPVPEAEQMIKRGVSSGFIRYYQYQYPLNRYRHAEQKSIQLAVINSCFYRHKHQYDGLLMLDLDEFVYSPINPTNLPVTLEYLLKTNIGDYFKIFSTMCSLRPEVSRTQSLKNATIFSDYVWKEPSRFSGRVKYMLRSSSESALSTHWCIGCVRASEIKEKTLMLYHFKARHNSKTKLRFDDSMKVHTPSLQKEVISIFGEL